MKIMAAVCTGQAVISPDRTCLSIDMCCHSYILVFQLFVFQFASADNPPWLSTLLPSPRGKAFGLCPFSLYSLCSFKSLYLFPSAPGFWHYMNCAHKTKYSWEPAVKPSCSADPSQCQSVIVSQMNIYYSEKTYCIQSTYCTVYWLLLPDYLIEKKSSFQILI